MIPRVLRAGRGGMTEAGPVRSSARRASPADLTHASADPTTGARRFQDAREAAIADRRGYVAWDADEVGARMNPLSPESKCVPDGTLEEAQAWGPRLADGRGAGRRIKGLAEMSAVRAWTRNVAWALGGARRDARCFTPTTQDDHLPLAAFRY